MYSKKKSFAITLAVVLVLIGLCRLIGAFAPTSIYIIFGVLAFLVLWLIVHVVMVFK